MKKIPDDLKPRFSAMNEIVTPVRSSLNVETIAALVFINSIGPPLTQLNAHHYVKSSLSKDHHSADDTASRKGKREKNTHEQTRQIQYYMTTD